MNKKKIINFIIVVVTIFTLLFVDFSPIVSWAEEMISSLVENGETEKVVFNAKWGNSDSTEKTVNADNWYSVNYNLELKGVQTGFNNLKITVDDNTQPRMDIEVTASGVDSSMVNYSKSNSRTLVFKDNIESGRATSGIIKVKFDKANDFQDYNKEINIVLTCEYADPNNGEIQYVYIKRTLNAIVKTPDFVDSFMSKIGYGTNSDNIVSKKTTSNSDYKVGEYRTTNIYVNTPFNFSGHNLAYGEYKVRVSRTGLNIPASETNTEENMQITISNVPDIVEKNIVRNSDGTVDIIFSVGTDKEEYTEDELFELSVNANIKIDYKIIENISRENVGSSIVTLVYSGNAKGYTITRGSSGVTLTAKNDVYTDSLVRAISLGYYFGDYLATSDITTSNIEKTTWKNLIKDNEIDLNWTTSTLYWDRRELANKQKLTIDNYSSDNYAEIEYTADDETVKTINLTNDELKLKRIEVNGLCPEVAFIEFYKKGDSAPFFKATMDNTVYEVPDDSVITEYYAVFDYMYGIKNNAYPGWNATYSLNVDSLKEELSNTEIENITKISKYQEGVFGSENVSINNKSTCNITIPSQPIKYSYYEMSISDFSTNLSSYGIYENASITLKMRNNDDNITKNNYLKNQNPKFYIKLPTCFNYDDINVVIRGGNGKLILEGQDEGEDAYYLDDETGLLVINCFGEWEHTDGEAEIKVSLKRKLNSYSVNSNYSIESYMLTDNANYIIGKTNNNLQLTKNGGAPEYVQKATSNFTIGTGSDLRIRNGVISDNNTIYPNNEAENALGTKENPVKFQNGDTVEYITEISSNGESISNISVLSRLPFSNNKSIYGTTYPLDSTISLTNLKNVRVTSRNSTVETDISADKYKIYYSLDEEVNFDSEFIEYIDGNLEFVNAKNIKIVMADNYTLRANNYLTVYFELDMPDAAGVAGQMSAIKCKRGSNSDFTILEPSAVYVTKGNPKGTLNLQKLFEGYSVGNAPSGVSLSNIEFKFKNLDTKEILVIDGVTDAEGKVKTNSTGKVTVTNIPQGRYQILEESNIEGFGKINYSSFEIVNGETIDKTVTNPRLNGWLNIQKIWNVDGNAQQGSVKLKVERNTGDSINFTSIVTTDEETGIAKIKVPYGTYKITEQQNLSGWKMADSPKSVTVTAEDGASVDVVNYLPKGDLTLTKKVPSTEGSSDTVLGISFRIEGTATAGSYIDGEGNRVYLDYDKTIVVGEEQDGITQTISDNQKSVTIQIPELYAGDYTITEIDAPKLTIDDEEVERYIALIKGVSLEGGKNNNVTIENVWRRGEVKIQKTADEGVELDKFKFRVYGTSYYGTNVDTIINIDRNGKGSSNILLGEYTIEEVGSDAFFAKYEVTTKGITKKTDESATIKVDGVNSVLINVNNENVDGYVKIVKNLEDKDDPSSAEGIQFEINGISPSGENIHETITIGEDGVGISNAIPAGGEYELTEVESTMPANYLPMDPREVVLTKANTVDNPLEINVENKRGRGNLEISTETMPENGPLFPIEYKVQEIEFTNTENGYARIFGTDKTLEADIYGRAKLNSIPAGTYIVEQTTVPTGWKKDMAQIVDVPIDNNGYATFVIEQEEQFDTSKVTISKTILNPQGEVATEDDYEKYKLVGSTSFEVKITNITNGKTYYTFISPEKDGVIDGLPQGIYEVEEVYKPKYLVQDYMLIDEDGVMHNIEGASGKYTFEIGSVESGKNEVYLHINNKINDGAGMCGQAHRDNLSKEIIEDEPEEKIVTRVGIIVVDEEGNKINNCTFELYDIENYNILEFTPRTKEVILKGLEPGNYTIKNIRVPEGYLLANDTDITVYKDAVRTKRIEIQKNIPRGDIVIQTVYDDNGKSKNVPSSKYKIVNNETGELLTFEKQHDGSYKRSNLPTATDTISLKAGKITVKGIETATYDVGIVDIADGYGIVNDTDVEITDIVQNQSKEITVQAVKRYIVDVQSSYYNSLVLDNLGTVWSWGYNFTGNGTGGAIYEPQHVIDNIKKISIGYYNRGALDNDGNLYVWGGNSYGALGLENQSNIVEPVKVDLGDKKIVDFSIGYESTLLIDEDGKIWYAGYRYGSGLANDVLNNYTNNAFSKFTCLSDIENSNFSNIKPQKVYCGYDTNAIIDEEGKLWNFGWSTSSLAYDISSYEDKYVARCVSLMSGNDIYEAYRNGIRLVDVGQNCALDENGNVYEFGTGKGFSANAVSITKAGGRFEGKKFIKLAGNNSVSYSSSSNTKIALIDEDHKLYIDDECVNNQRKFRDVEFTNVTVGYYTVIAVDKNSNLYGNNKGDNDSYAQSGANRAKVLNYSYDKLNFMEFQMPLPNYSSNFRYDMKFQKVDIGNYITIALDYEGDIWTWGTNYTYNGLGNSGVQNNPTPRRVEFNEDIKFKDIASYKYGYGAFALDNKGRVWSWGYTWGSDNGTGSQNSSNALERICISELLEEENPLAIDYSHGITIEKIKSNYSIALAIDSVGRIWAWGSNATNISSGINKYVPTCIGYNAKDVEYFQSGLAILTKDNKLMFLDSNNGLRSIEGAGDNSRLSVALRENPFKIVKISSNSYNMLILDEYGRVWYKYSYDTDYNLSEDQNGILKEKYREGKKIAEVSYTYNGYPCAIDEDGVLYYNVYGSGGVEYNQTQFASISTYGGSNIAIGRNGYLYVWGGNEGKLGNGSTLSVNEITCLNSSATNPLYGKTFRGFESAYVIDTDGYPYRVGSEFSKYARYLSDIYLEQGKTIKKQCDLFTLFTDGTLCYDKSDLSLSNSSYSYYTYSNIDDIMSVKCASKIVYIALTNDGKILMSDTSYNYHLYNISFYEDAEVEFKRLVYSNGGYQNAIIEDQNGDYWICISNSYGLMGDGTTVTDYNYKYKKIVLNETTKLKDILLVTDENIYAIDENDVLWGWGVNKDCRLGTSNTNTVSTPLRMGVTVADFQVVNVYNYWGISSCYFVMILDKDGYVWTTGGNVNLATTCTRFLGKSSYTLGKVNNSNNMGKVVKICLSSGSAYAINEAGEIWVWGVNAFGNLAYPTSMTTFGSNNYIFSSVSSPVCLTNTVGNIFYQKHFKEIYDLSTTSAIKHYKRIQSCGNGEVYLIDDEDNVYLLGADARNLFSNYTLYRESNTAYPQPQLKYFKILEWYEEYGSRYFKADDGNFYNGLYTLGESTINNYNITSDMSCEDLYNRLNDKKYYNYDEGYAMINSTRIDFPENIDIACVGYSNGTYYIIDTEGNLYVKGSYSGIGVTTTDYVNVTQLQILAEPSFNTIRGRWNLIKRKF